MILAFNFLKIEKLSEIQLNHMIQLCDLEIKIYEKLIVNYPPERMERCGLPHLEKLKQNKITFENQLKTFIS